MTNWQELRAAQSAAQMALRITREYLIEARAEAEVRAIEGAGEKGYGKNDAERNRYLILALKADEHYQDEIDALSVCETEANAASVALESACDERREREWAIRARLADALLGASQDEQAEAADTALDDIADFAVADAVMGIAGIFGEEAR